MQTDRPRTFPDYRRSLEASTPCFSTFNFQYFKRPLLFSSGICKRGRQKGVSLICSENKSKQIRRKQSKSEQIGAFQKTRSANQNKSEENGEIRTNRKKSGRPPSANSKLGAPIFCVLGIIFMRILLCLLCFECHSRL